MKPTPQQQALDAITAVLNLIKCDPNAALAIPGSESAAPEAATVRLIATLAFLAA
jgi:hypothetical protein